MASLIEKMYDAIMPKADPRMDDFYFVRTCLQPMSVFGIYYILVRYIGPKFMENRKPYKLQNALIIYNAFQVILSAYTFHEAFDYWFGQRFSWFKCASVDYSRTPEAYRVVTCCYIYYISKYTELLDTIFFVLRKKYNQVSFLHVYHHGSMPLYTYISLKAAPGGSFVAIILLNSFVHIIMYGYYMFAAMGPQFQKYLWWKKYLTSLQLVQFVLLLVHFLVICFTDCNIPGILANIFTFNIVTNFVLFSFFYNKSYRKPTETTNSNTSVQSKGFATILEGERLKENCWNKEIEHEKIK